MKALDWLRAIEAQSRDHGKTLFTGTELANLAGLGPVSAATEIHRLCSRAILSRHAHGIYGLPGVVTIDELLPLIDACAYVTGLAALARHGYATQIVRTVDCLTSRRPRRPRAATTIGDLLFHTAKPPVFAFPPEGVVAPSEQALCDYVQLARRSGADPRSLATLRGLDRMNRTRLEATLRRYPATVRDEVARLIAF